jgi:hypothetical protein
MASGGDQVSAWYYWVDQGGPHVWARIFDYHAYGNSNIGVNVAAGT